MHRNNGLVSHALIRSTADGAIVMWFLNDHPLGYRDFDDVTHALRWCNQMQVQNWAVGWRLAADS